MKSFRTYIIEHKRVFTGLNRPCKPQYTYEELVLDYQRTQCVTDAIDKRELADKYNTTRSISAISESILRKLLMLRWYKEEFTDEDIVHYNKLNPPSLYDKLNIFLKNENPQFCEVLLSKYNDVLENNDLKKYVGCQSKAELTVTEKYQIKAYENMSKYIQSIT